MSSRIAGSAEGSFASVNPDSCGAAGNSVPGGVITTHGMLFRRRLPMTGESLLRSKVQSKSSTKGAKHDRQATVY
jgi:hypothetical protein